MIFKRKQNLWKPILLIHRIFDQPMKLISSTRNGGDDMQLVIDGISKSFENKGRETIALEGINLVVNKEEFVAIVGPSGCGKSTLLNIIAGLTSPTAGEVYFERNDNDIDLPNISIVFQEAGLMPWRTVKENIRLGLEKMKISEEEKRKRIEKYIKMVGLEGFENAYPYQLSGGMKQ